eukprot:364433_1
MSESQHANKDCSGIQFFVVGITCIDSIVLLSNLFVLFQFIYRYNSTTEIYRNKPAKILYYTGLVFAVFIIILQSLMLVITLHGCRNEGDKKQYEHAMDAMFLLFYIFQSYLLSIIVFMTLKYSFRDTAFALSKRTINKCKVIYVFIPILGICNVMFNNTTIGAIFAAILILVLLSFFISMIVLFIRKLISIYKNIDADANLIRKITKLTVLSCVSMSLTLLVPIIMFIILSTNVRAAIGSSIFFGGVLLDTTTNLLCIVMTYGYFNDYYVKICYCMHNICQSTWGKFIGDEARILASIARDDKSGTGNTVELSIDETQTQTQMQMQSQSPTEAVQTPQSIDIIDLK